MVFPTSIVATCLDGILNVAGAPAAFWGATDVFYLRNENNNEAFRIAAMTIGSVALVRYFILNAADSDKYNAYLKSYKKANLWGRMVRTIESPVSYFKKLGQNATESCISFKDYLTKKSTPSPEQNPQENV